MLDALCRKMSKQKLHRVKAMQSLQKGQTGKVCNKFIIYFFYVIVCIQGKNLDYLVSLLQD